MDDIRDTPPLPPAQDPSPQEILRPRVSIRFDHAPSTGLALAHCGAAVCHRIELENTGEETARDLVLEWRLDRGLSETARADVGELGPGEKISIPLEPLKLNRPELAKLDKRESTQLVLTLRDADQVVAQTSAPMEVLARDEWSGFPNTPASLACFVQPNTAAVQGVLEQVWRRVEAVTGLEQPEGYEHGDTTLVNRRVAAAYHTLIDMGLRRADAETSPMTGPVRLSESEAWIEAGLGTDLEVHVLFAALLEAMGLRPLLILYESHVHVAVWTDALPRVQVTVEDAAGLHRHAEDGELLVLDLRGALERPWLPFEQALERGRAELETNRTFVLAIDVHCARRHGFGPLSEEPQQQSSEAEPPEGQARIAAWKRRLLDLSLRNRLLAFRETKKTLTILAPDLVALEDALSQGRTFQVGPRPQLPGTEHIKDPVALRAALREDPSRPVQAAFEAGQLCTPLGQDELERRMLELYRAARLRLQETGTHSLYLAVGFLHWLETPTASEHRRAPLLLIPLETERKSAREPICVRLADEDAQLNVTLLEKLRVEFGITVPELERLPEDEHGLDVPAILNAFRRAILDRPDWEVRDELRLGLFSFTKFLMWSDLEQRSDELSKHPLVARWIGASPGTEDQTLRVDNDAALPFPIEEQFAPLPADSSQLRAIASAARGRTFVLEGPPGTGKSQTIANLIAQCLADGQRVLFVAEKQAALQVVNQRLEQAGLGAFCLELHSDKSSKRAVLEQLGEAFELAGLQESPEWSAKSDELETLRARLNGHVDVIHRTYPVGESVFGATARLIELGEGPRVALGLENPLECDAAWFAGALESLASLSTAAGELADISQHPLRQVQRKDWSAGLAEQVDTQAQGVVDAVLRYRTHLSSALRSLGLAGALGDQARTADLDRIEDTTEQLLECPSPTREMLTAPDWSGIEDEASTWIARGREKDILAGDYSREWSDSLLDTDVEGTQSKWAESQESFPLVRWWRRRGLLKGLSQHTAFGSLPHRDDLAASLDRAIKLRETRRQLSDPKGFGTRMFGTHWKGGSADWEQLEVVVEWSRGYRNRLQQGLPGGEPVRQRLLELATEGSAEVAADVDMRRALMELRSDRQRLDREGTSWCELLEIQHDPDQDHLTWLESSAYAVQENKGQLRAWCHWQRMRQAAEDAGLGPIAAALESSELEAGQACEAFERSFWSSWLVRAMDADECLRQFNGAEHERLIERFRGLDAAHRALSSEVLQARLAAAIPPQDERATPNSELGIFQRELRKKQRHLPIRRLLMALPNLLPRLKPCFLMSPLSVAQYLDPSLAPFDVVVFDEASQIPVWDAVGAIARGRSTIVVGDSRQLPPTTFFHKGDGDDVFEEELEELESVLDESVAAGLPRLALSWHYRSQHEGLIAFSNHEYYGGELFTFPRAEGRTRDLGVSFHRVTDGVYDRGKSRTNRMEAETLVKRLVQLLEDSMQRGLDRTFGIVTLNLPQQRLIEDLVDQARRQRPEIESFFDNSRAEALFVKNLENVQGDERDVILLSVGYGPDSRGRLSMGFGPLNLPGGERRLNVAITRARQRLETFASLGPEDIDLSRTNAVGARHLKAFLEYAERGPSSLSGAPRDPAQRSGRSQASRILEADVAEALRARGHTVALGVGSSAARLDLAIVDPEQPQNYLLGIDCDGDGYSQAPSARDRECTRPGLLESLGWKLAKVWSLDWWLDRQGVLERIERCLTSEPSGAAADPLEEVPGITEAPALIFGATSFDQPELEEPLHAELESLPLAGDTAEPDLSAQDTLDPLVPPVEPDDDKTLAEVEAILEADTSAALEELDHPALEAEQQGQATQPEVQVDEWGKGPPDSSVLDELRVSPTAGSVTESVEEAFAAFEPEPEPEPDPIPRPEPSAIYSGPPKAREESGPTQSPAAPGPSFEALWGEFPYSAHEPGPEHTLRADFHESKGAEHLRDLVLKTLLLEAPIHRELLHRRVFSFYAGVRPTSMNSEEIDELIEALPRKYRPRMDGDFYWRQDQRPDEWPYFRRHAAQSDARRDFAQIPLQEIGHGMSALLRLQISMPEEDLMRETGKLFGYTRLGGSIRERLGEALAWLEGRRGCRREGERIAAPH